MSNLYIRSAIMRHSYSYWYLSGYIVGCHVVILSLAFCPMWLYGIIMLCVSFVLHLLFTSLLSTSCPLCHVCQPIVGLLPKWSYVFSFVLYDMLVSLLASCPMCDVCQTVVGQSAVFLFPFVWCLSACCWPVCCWPLALCHVCQPAVGLLPYMTCLSACCWPLVYYVIMCKSVCWLLDLYVIMCLSAGCLLSYMSCLSVCYVHVPSVTLNVCFWYSARQWKQIGKPNLSKSYAHDRDVLTSAVSENRRQNQVALFWYCIH